MSVALRVPVLSLNTILSLVTAVSLVVLNPLAKMDSLTQARMLNVTGNSRVIVRTADGASVTSLLSLVTDLGGTVLGALPLVNAQLVELPNLSLVTLALNPAVERISFDRLLLGAMERTG